MLLPLLLSLFATLAAAVMSYGVHSGLAKYSWGLSVIMLSRRIQWPLIALSLTMCFALLGLVISGKRRAWWLIALAPVMTLFVHRFWTNPINRYVIANEPAFVSTNEATFLHDDDDIVAVDFTGEAYAYPFRCLARAPVVMQTDREHRLLLLWSWRPATATALSVTRDLKARDLTITSEPVGVLLIYNSRRGQFISAATGLTPRGEKPANVTAEVKTSKGKWKEWRAAHPQGRVMEPF